MESENKVNVVVPENYNGTPIEITFREGEAPVVLDPKEPEKISIRAQSIHLSVGLKSVSS